RRFSGQEDRTGAWSRLDDHEAVAVEGVAARGLVRLVAARIAVSDAQDLAGAADAELDLIRRRRRYPPSAVQDRDLDHCDVFPIREDAGAVGAEPNGCGRAGGLDAVGGRLFAAVEAAAFE